MKTLVKKEQEELLIKFNEKWKDKVTMTLTYKRCAVIVSVKDQLGLISMENGFTYKPLSSLSHSNLWASVNDNKDINENLLASPRHKK